MMPHDEELEKIVLGSIILESSCLLKVTGITKEEHFYNDVHKFIYRAITTLHEQNTPVDLLTVTTQLNKIGRLVDCGGAYYVSSLTNRLGGVANIETHCRLLYEKFLLREIIKLSHEIGHSAAQQNADCFELIEKLNKGIANMTSIEANSIEHIGKIHARLINEIGEVLRSGKPTGMLTGLENLDKHTGGWQNGNLIILASRPAMGKTATALQFAKYPAMNLGVPTAIFSMEMSSEELVGRMVSSETGLNSTKINHKALNLLELDIAKDNCKDLVRAQIHFDKSATNSLNQFKSKAYKMYNELGVRLIIVDYLQLMKTDDKVREREIAAISRGLKIIAKELNIPIIALAQLNRECEKRDDKRPMLSDLRDSGGIEQDADIVAFLYRPKYYDLYENGYEFGDRILETNNLLLLDIAKGRGLKTGEIPLKFFGETMTVVNYNY